MNDTIIYYGDGVKALGEGRVGGYLIRYGGRDLHGEYFTEKTYFGIADGDQRPTLFNHGLPIRGRFKGQMLTFEEPSDALPLLKMERRDLGVWAEVVLDMADEYQRKVYELVERGALGWSSGTQPHTAKKNASGEITRWLIAEGSLTPAPAEPRNRAMSIKSLIDDESTEVIPALEPEAAPEDANSIGDAVTADNEPIVHIEVMENHAMSEEQTNVTPPLSANDIEAKFAAFSAQLDKVMDHIENSPRLMKTGYYAQDGGTNDANVKSFGDFLLAVKRRDEQRLVKHYKAQTESSATGGGYLIPEQYINELIQMVQTQSGIVGRVRNIPVQSPSGEMPALDQFLTPTAGGGDTALTAGINTNKRSEAGAYAAETAAFTNLSYRVYDALSGYVRTSRELSEDAPAIESLLRQLIAASMQNKLEYFILFGSGVGEPLGVLNANNDAAVSVDAATNDAFVIGDVMNILSHFKGMGQPVWVAHPSVLPDIGQLSNGSGAVSYTSNLQSPMSMQLMGYPIIISEHMAQTNNPKDIALIDFSMYYLFTRGSAYIDFSRDADFLNGNDTWRFGQRIDGKPALKNRITLADAQGSFYVSPYVYNND